jgi:hypothetical protein
MKRNKYRDRGDEDGQGQEGRRWAGTGGAKMGRDWRDVDGQGQGQEG